MEVIMKHLFLCALVALMPFFCFAADTKTTEPEAAPAEQFKNPLGKSGPMTPEELMIKRAELTKKASEMLTSLVGQYSSVMDIDGEKRIFGLTINPAILNGHYYQGNYTVKSESGDTLYEAFTVFTFNPGAMSYLFFYFENDGYVRNYAGGFTDGNIVIQTPHPGGMETNRWTPLDDGTLRHETWNPSNSAESFSNRVPDQVIVFKKSNP
jgi:hypothetical protein